MDEVTLPYFREYRVSSHIQFNRRTKHFRTLKLFGQKVFILDINSVTEIDGYENIDSEIHHSDWATYIMAFQRK
jgi:hypothetical protein